MSGSIDLSVPGSTSNLGPGFDLLGLCIGLWVRLHASPLSEGEAMAIEHAAAVEWEPEDDLVMRSIRAYEGMTGRTLPPHRVQLSSEIPVGRGFGSSGAAVSAGLLFAAAVDGNEAALTGDRAPLVKLAAALEGHPDNGTASLLGGCTLAAPHANGIAVVRQPVHPSLGVAVAWPEAPLFTDASRAVLPETVPFADAVENPRRLALLLEGLRSGDMSLLELGVEDRLHERFRRALIPGSDAACDAARTAGAHFACLSGAGSGLVAFGPKSRTGAIADAMASKLTGGQGRAVDAIRDAPRPFP